MDAKGMREILFRGKDPETRKWYEGFYMALSDTTYCFEEDYAAHPENTKHYIVFDEMTDWCLPNRHLRVEVDPSTVGQYTGLKDKNGKRIFEGDIVAQNWYDYDEPRDDSFGNVEFCEYDCSFSVMDVNKDGFMPLGRCGSYHWEVEVIGNVHDNPELLKGAE